MVVPMSVRRLAAGIRRRVPISSRLSGAHAAQYLPGNPTVVEAGAHIGTDTVLLARRWPTGTVHAFEPVPHVYRQMEARTRGLANVHRYPAALGATTGTASMWLSSGSKAASSSVLPPKHHLRAFPEIGFERKIDVPLTTLEDWATRHQITCIDFMWLDLQGYEYAVLSSAGFLLSTVRAVILEVFFEELYEGAPLWPEVRQWLHERDLVTIREHRAHESYGEALVVRRGLL